MSTRPRTRIAAAGLPAGVLLALLVSGCSHYRIGIPIAPGLAIGLGATKDGNFSVGLNTGFGPLGAGVAVHNSGVVAGSVGMGAGIGPAGVGVGQSVVLHDPNAGQANALPTAPVTSMSAGVGGAGLGMGVTKTLLPGDGSQPAAEPLPLPSTATASTALPAAASAPAVRGRGNGVVVRRGTGGASSAAAPPVRIVHRPPEAVASAPAASGAGPAREIVPALGSPANPIAP
ncbi:hypothetical protein ACEN9J_18500 [Variovorax sp. Varisp41]|uniref:hypothetical protein n=1 Tax=Variovorax sp. Varisp41 TaxID=3243033 RepID=UPI0039B5F6FF